MASYGGTTDGGFGVSFDELLTQIQQRVITYSRSHSPEIETVLGDTATAEADRLWRFAQPADTGNATAEDDHRLSAARRALGWLYFQRWDASRDSPDLRELARAIEFLEPLADDTAAIPGPLHAVLGGSAEVAAQAALARQMLAHAESTADPILLRSSIGLFTASLAVTPPDGPERAALQSSLGGAYALRFQRDGALADLNRAIELLGDSLAATPNEDPGQSALLHNLGGVHMLRFQRDGKEVDLNRAIEVWERLVVATPVDHPDRVRNHINLLGAYNARFERSGRTTDLSRSIELLEVSATATAVEDPDRAEYLSSLGGAYGVRFERNGLSKDLDRAVEVLEQSVALTPPGEPTRVMSLFNLGTAYKVRFDRDRVSADLNLAIDTLEQAVTIAPAGHHPEQAAALSNLGAAYDARFERTGSVSDINRAIEMSGRAVAVIPVGHPDRPKALSNLGTAYQARFERTGLVTDINRAIEMSERAMTATPAGHPDRVAYLFNLGGAYRARFARNGAQGDLNRAIEMWEETAADIPAGHPNRPLFLSNLGGAYNERFAHSGAEADLNHAIEVLEDAVTTAPADQPDQAMALSNLGSAYKVRFVRSGVEADLNHAIEVLERSVAATPADHPNRIKALSNLGGAYGTRFERRGLPVDLDLAIDTLGRSVAAIPADHPDRAAVLSNLGSAYAARFERTGLPADLDHAIELSERSVAGCPADHPDRAGNLCNLGTFYRTRFEHSGQPADLDHAIKVLKRTVVLTSAHHPAQAPALYNLCAAYYLRFDAGGEQVDQETLSMLAGRALAAVTAPSVDAVRVRYMAGVLASAMDDRSLAVELLDSAVTLMPSTMPRESGWEDQEHRIGGYTNLFAEAVAAHCSINDPAGAVEIAELGRGVLLAGQLDSRSDLTDLDHAFPDLAARLRRLRELLGTPHPSNTTPGEPLGAMADRVKDRKRWWAEHDDLLTQVRQHSGFERFLQPPRLSDLQPALAGGTVIVVNAGQQRGDAIILAANTAPILVQLPELTRDDVALHARELLEASHGAGLTAVLQRQRVIPETLEWLWDTIVHPILRAAPVLTATSTSLPRVWWLPIGLLGLFPLHAAGRPGEPGALDTLISSYTPTLRALAHAHTRQPATTRRQLTVAMQHTPGQPDLPGIVTEAATLHSDQPDTSLLLDETATTSNVLAALPDATWVHFACHAGIDFVAPSRSGLCLHDATLSLPEISRLHLTHAELVYLSACSTAHRNIEHVDESLHPASAFQLAGFRHVVASLWPLDDPTAASASAMFYQMLPATATAEDAATAIHHTTRKLRAQFPTRPDWWAGLIHSGP